MNLAASLFLCDIMIQNDLNLKILMPVSLFLVVNSAVWFVSQEYGFDPAHGFNFVFCVNVVSKVQLLCFVNRKLLTLCA